MSDIFVGMPTSLSSGINYLRYGLVRLWQNPTRVVRTLATGVHFLTLYYRYPDTFPSPGEVIEFDPDMLRHSLASDDRPTTWFRRGVVGGEWDCRMEPFWSTPLRRGLRQRFEEGRPWEETTYYESAIDKLRRGVPLKRLGQREQSIDGLTDYLDHLDALYVSIRSDGFDPESPITVNIGRDGSIMLDHGNHRSAMAKIADVSSIHATVRYRHTKWQQFRSHIYSDVDRYSTDDWVFEHPDIAGKTF